MIYLTDFWRSDYSLQLASMVKYELLSALL